MTTGIKALWQNLLVVIISTVIAAIFAEIVLRIVLPPPIVWEHPQEQYKFDEETGHWLEANQQAYTHDKPVATNSEGIRDADYSFRPPEGTFRVLALGDSQTFGNGLDLSDTWPKQLEAELTSISKDKNIEVLNGGLPASDTWQHEIILKRLLVTYNPDAVVLAFYVNDVVKRFTPRPVQRNDNETRKKITYLLKSSSLLLTLRTVWSSVSQSSSPNPGFLQQQALLNGENTPELEERWSQVAESLASMKTTSDSQNVFFGVAMLPRRDQIDGRMPWEAYSDRLREIAEANRIPVVSVLEGLQEAYKANGKDLFIPWDGHNSKIANHVIAREIAGQLLVVR